MSSHTPGPWAISKTDPRLVKHLSGPVLAECGPVNAEEARANARLISAAPDLVDALARLTGIASTQLDTSFNHLGLQNLDAIVAARAAIAKARGE